MPSTPIFLVDLSEHHRRRRRRSQGGLNKKQPGAGKNKKFKPKKTPYFLATGSNFGPAAKGGLFKIKNQKTAS